MKRTFPLILLSFIVVACSPGSEPATPIPPTPEPTSEAAGATENLVEQPTATLTERAPATDIPAEDPTTTPAATEPTEEPTTEPTAMVEPTPEEAAAFNGSYENTYFRGSTTAPVMMIDYSDFL